MDRILITYKKYYVCDCAEILRGNETSRCVTGTRCGGNKSIVVPSNGTLDRSKSIPVMPNEEGPALNPPKRVGAP
jgi:hypothetical protein